MKLSGGAIVGATLIAAPLSTKNREQAQDPEMCQSKKGNQWHDGYPANLFTAVYGLNRMLLIMRILLQSYFPAIKAVAAYFPN
jgi:hypothetical protein